MRARLIRLLIALSLVSLPVSICAGTGSASCSCCCDDAHRQGPKAPASRMPCCDVAPAPEASGTLAARVVVERAVALLHLPVIPLDAAAPSAPAIPRPIAIAGAGPPGLPTPLRV